MELLARGTNIQENNLDPILATGSEAQKRNYMVTLSHTTHGTISLHLQDAPNNPEAARLALTTLLRRKGRILDAVTNSLQTLRQNLTPEDQELLDELAAIRSQLAALMFKGAGDTSPEDYHQQVAELKAEANQLENTLSRRSAEFRVESQPVTIEAVQQLIPADTALVELVQYKPYNAKKRKGETPRYAAYILHSTGEPQWLDLGEAAPINETVAQFRHALQHRSGTIQPIARTLDEQLMQPIREKLGDTHKLLLSPDSQLNLIPFAALVDENNNYLVENYSITYLTSGRDLLKLQHSSPSQTAPLLVANPDYSNPGDSAPIACKDATCRVSTSTGGEGTRSTDSQRSTDLTQIAFNPLPGTAQEAAAIAPMLPEVTLLTESEATENAIKQTTRPQILHIATHGFFLEDIELVASPAFGTSFLDQRSLYPEPDFGAIPRPQIANPENPLLRSGLALAGFNPRQSGEDDGVLTALEAAGLNLYGTKLVVLSACETGVGAVNNGEGVYGLRRAFTIAGAESQVMSLWKVSDEGTKDLMVSYYQRLLENEGRSEALRQVQLEMLRSQQYQHPYFWASFIPSGDWTPMN
jgi:CHAT domain-containing protein